MTHQNEGIERNGDSSRSRPSSVGRVNAQEVVVDVHSPFSAAKMSEPKSVMSSTMNTPSTFAESELEEHVDEHVDASACLPA